MKISVKLRESNNTTTTKNMTTTRNTTTPKNATAPKIAINLKPTKRTLDPPDMIDLRTRKVEGSDEEINIPENVILVQQFKRLVDFTDFQIAQEGARKHQFRRRQFQNALSAIKTYPEPIQSGYHAQKNIPNVGKGISKRIDEILQTGTLAEIDVSQFDSAQTVLDLVQIPGIGVKTALRLMENFGVRSLEHLRQMLIEGTITEGKNQLTRQMVLGLRYHDDLKYRIPHDEISLIKKRMEKVLVSIDPHFKMEVCGSYRRGKKTSGDIDVLITHPDATDSTEVNDAWMSTIIRTLIDQHLIIDKISQDKTKFMGYCRLSDQHLARHIDIMFIPNQSWGTAILYFTGSAKFNILMRTEALKKGFTLSEHGMCRLVSGVKDEKGILHFGDERSIFDFLSIKYLTPSEREF